MSLRAFLPRLGVCILCPAQRVEEIPKFRAETTFVEFTIVVLDNKGNPVTDLKKEEVSIADNGRNRQLSAFRFDGAQIGARSSGQINVTPPLPPGTFSNLPEHIPAAVSRSFTAIVLDTNGSSTASGGFSGPYETNDQTSARAMLLRYMQQLPEHTRVAAYRLGYGVTVLHDFTADPASLRDRIARADLSASGPPIDPGDPPLAPGGETAVASRAEASAAAVRAVAERNLLVRDSRLTATLVGLEAIGNRVAGIPGRRSLVWITNGSPIRIVTNGSPKSYEVPLRDTARRLASQGIAVYPVDVRGLTTASLPPGGRYPGNGVAPQIGSEVNQLASMELFAEVTGGRVVKYSKRSRPRPHLAAADQRGARSLEFNADAPDGQWHHLKVAVSRPGIRLSYQQGYLAQAHTQDSHDWPPDESRLAANHPLGSNAIRFNARCELTAGALRMILEIRPAKSRLPMWNSPSRKHSVELPPSVMFTAPFLSSKTLEADAQQWPVWTIGP